MASAAPTAEKKSQASAAETCGARTMPCKSPARHHPGLPRPSNMHRPRIRPTPVATTTARALRHAWPSRRRQWRPLESPVRGFARWPATLTAVAPDRTTASSRSAAVGRISARVLSGPLAGHCDRRWSGSPLPRIIGSSVASGEEFRRVQFIAASEIEGTAVKFVFAASRYNRDDRTGGLPVFGTLGAIFGFRLVGIRC